MKPFNNPFGDKVVYTRRTRIAGLTPDGVLLVNPDTYRRLPLPARIFVVYHEYAHALGIRVEQEADIFAASNMKAMGYSDRDVALAHALTLSAGSSDNNARVAAVIEYLEKRKKGDEIT
mgnify:CR=1 FL=1